MKIIKGILVLLGRGLGFGLLGLVVGIPAGILLYSLYDLGYFTSWERLGAAPAGTVELPSSQGWTLYARTESGEIYQRSEFDAAGSWSAGASLPESRGDYFQWEALHPCQRDWPVFSFYNGTPGSIVDCVQDRIQDVEFGLKHVYVLDKNGIIWEWHLMNGWGQGMGFVFGIPMLEGFFGLLFGLAWVIQGWLAGYLRGKKVRFPVWWEQLPALVRLMIGGAVLQEVLGVVLICFSSDLFNRFFLSGMAISGAFFGLIAGLAPFFVKPLKSS
jgi:hypothetical protein